MTLEAVREAVAAATRRSGRVESDVTLVAVSKGRSVAEIAALYDQGQRDFGENRADELARKVGELPADVRWHFVGHLQSNKARVVRPTGAVLHSLESDSLAAAWLKGPGTSPPCYLQVNIGGEPQKSGVDPDEAEGAVLRYRALGLDVVGLMAILPIVDRPDDARPWFRQMVALRSRISSVAPAVTGLSMGMTDDFEVAVEEGATVIRVGRAIFEAQPE